MTDQVPVKQESPSTRAKKSPGVHTEAVVASDTGLVKVVCLDRSIVTWSWGKPSLKRPVVCLSWGRSKNEVVAAFKGGMICLFDISVEPPKDKVLHVYRYSCVTTKVPKRVKATCHIIGMNMLPCKGKDPYSRLVCVDNVGEATIHHIHSTWPQIHHDNYPTEEHRWHLGRHVACIDVDPDRNGLMAIGGDNVLPQMWNLHTQSCVWKAKNLPHDKLNLRSPIGPTSLQFVPGTSAAQLLVATRYHQVQLYDRSMGRRAVWSVDVGTVPLQSLRLHPTGTMCVVGDGLGDIHQVSLRDGSIVGKFKGAAGSIKALAFHPTHGALLSTGLDRFVHIHQEKGRRLHKKKVYVKQRMTHLLVRSVLPVAGYTKAIASGEDQRHAVVIKEEDEDHQEDDDGDDVVWSRLPRDGSAQAQGVERNGDSDVEEVEEGHVTVKIEPVDSDDDDGVVGSGDEGSDGDDEDEDEDGTMAAGAVASAPSVCDGTEALPILTEAFEAASHDDRTRVRVRPRRTKPPRLLLAPTANGADQGTADADEDSDTPAELPVSEDDDSDDDRDDEARNVPANIRRKLRAKALQRAKMGRKLTPVKRLREHIPGFRQRVRDPRLTKVEVMLNKPRDKVKRKRKKRKQQQRRKAAREAS